MSGRLNLRVAHGKSALHRGKRARGVVPITNAIMISISKFTFVVKGTIIVLGLGLGLGLLGLLVVAVVAAAVGGEGEEEEEEE